jgi:periplasmic protein TonB
MSLVQSFTFATFLAVASSPVLSAQDRTVYTSRDGVTLPSVVRQVKPEYTKSGLDQRIQGSVVLSSVILADGTVSDVRIERSLDEASGLDQAAVDAMKQWQFKPGTKDGQPVAVKIQCELTFTLK